MAKSRAPFHLLAMAVEGELAVVELRNRVMGDWIASSTAGPLCCGGHTAAMSRAQEYASAMVEFLALRRGDTPPEPSPRALTP